ncbi:uncharacterized protein LOC134289472 isoform X2 [Aedes albopictus]
MTSTHSQKQNPFKPTDCVDEQQPGPSTRNSSSSSPSHIHMDSTKESSLSQMFTWSGSRTSHGFAYEKDLAFTLFVAASLEERRFRLATEMKEAGKFDDAVLILDDREEIWFFQAKHSQSSNAKIEYEEFFPSSFEENSQFSLPMYIQSFLNVSKRSELRNYTKRFIIFTNKTIDENTRHELGEHMDIKSCASNDPLENKVFIRKTEKYVPKADQIQSLLIKVNELPVAIKDAIIELQRSGAVKSVLRKYTTPLRSILKIDSSVRFSETFTGNEDEINQRWLWHELQTHYITQDETTKRLSEVIFSKKVDKRLLQNKSGETSFPRFIEESDLRSFFECLVICTDQPDKLSSLRDNITESVVGKWVHERDRGLVSDKAKFHVVFEKEFENWHMVTNLEGNQKPFLSSYEGNMCVQMIKAEVRRLLQKVTAADFSSYVERTLASQNGQKEFTEDGFISKLEQPYDQNRYILVGKPGTGKTIFMKKITYSLQTDYNKHVYLICLNGLFKNYEEQNDIFTLMKSSHFTRSTQKFIQNSLENYPKQCFILLDGFDEIDTQHQGTAIKLIKETFCKNNIRVFISGRNHVKRTLEKKLQVEALNLVPLVEDEQLLFLRNYWDISSEISQNDSERFKKIAKRLLELLHDSIQSEYFNFTGLPLMVRMLAEVNKEKFEQYWRSTNDQMNEILDLENGFSKLRLYESFVNMSFNIFIRKTNNEEGYASVDLKIKNFFKDNLDKFYRAHQIIAIAQLNVPQLRETLSNNDSVTILENMLQILDDGEKSLLINASNKIQLEFTHLSYAEYFLSNFLYDHVLDWEAILFDVLHRYEVVRTFFFSMIEENWDNSKLQMNTIINICRKTPGIMYLSCSDGYELIFKELLKHQKAKQLFEYSWQSNKATLLHAAVQSRKENILKYVLCDHQFGDCTNHGASNNKTETYKSEIDMNTPDSRGALPIHYAVSVGNEAIVNMLAQHGADKSIHAEDIYGNTPLHNAADVGIVKLLIHKYSADYKIANNAGETLIHLATERGNMEVVQLLIDDYAADVNAQDNDGNTPLLLAAKCRNWEMVKMLIDKDSKYSADYKIANKAGETLIQLAIIKGEIEIVEMLKDHAADLNVRNCYGKTPLHYAAFYCKWEIVKMLIGKDSKYLPDYKIINGDVNTLFYIAAFLGKMEIIQMLRDDYAADVNAQDSDGNTPLLLAARRGKWELVKMLINKHSKNSADYKIANKAGQTHIHLAAEGGHTKIVKMLIDDYAADVNAQDNDGNTPLLLAAKNYVWEMVKMLIDKDSKYSADYKIANKAGQTLIHLAAEGGNMEIVQMLRDDYAADVNAQDNDGNTPLHYAAQYSTLEMVKMLIVACSMDYKIVNKFGKSLIHSAAGGGKLGTVKMLIDDYAVDINAQDFDGNTPLHYAAHFSTWVVVKMLIIAYSMDYKIVNKFGKSLIHSAVAGGKLETVKMLIDDYASDANKQDNDGNTPLLLAAKCRNWEMVKMLIDKDSKYSANYRIANKHGKTVIHLATMGGNMEIVNMLRDDYAADVNVQDNDGNTPLHYAAENSMWEMVNILIVKYRANFNATNKSGQTPFHIAALKGQWDVVKMLLADYALAVNTPNGSGRTLLHLATENNNLEAVKMLIHDHSADIDCLDSKGRTPFQVATERGHKEVVDELAKVQNAEFSRNFEKRKIPQTEGPRKKKTKKLKQRK